MKRPIICLAVLSLLSVVSGKAPDFASVFNTGMVLQQGRELTICGNAEPGEEISLEFAGQKVTGKTGKDGVWQLKLAPLSISRTPQTMTLTGPSGIRKLNDILVGEVWLCSGQSNMYWPLDHSLNGTETAAASNYPEVRVFGNYNQMADSPQVKTSAIWQKLTPDRAATMSAVVFYFGRKLYQELKIPIGLICAYRGGTMEYWFAEGVGIVKFLVHFYFDASKTAVWELTSYEGGGEGFFPVCDGMLRRYEPKEVFNGWHGSVEYTFDEDETGTVLFRNALGTQDRANYEKNNA